MRAMKSSTLRRSGRSSNTGCAVNEDNASASQPSRVAFAAMSGFNEFLNVFLRCPKEVLTMFLNAASSHPNDVLPLRFSRMTADCTFGGGAKALLPLASPPTCSLRPIFHFHARMRKNQCVRACLPHRYRVVAPRIGRAGGPLRCSPDRCCEW